MASAITDDFHVPPTRAAAMDGLRTAGPPIRRSEPLKIVYRPIEQLKPDPANPRLHSKKQIRQIAKSIEAFGFNVPLLIDADLNLIAGHCRLFASRELGMREVPTLASIT